MIIYKVPGLHRGPKGTTYSYRDADEGKAIPKGWHKSLEAAVDAHLPPKKRKPKAKE